ncbi:MAG: prolipoprotein diacylglyceryl transferase [Endomicrobium sp.]|jgi:phosphatidylglycerol:prolipoprotein diacylglycerol transferase|nr:prolipoprotein diacylglyceryl transferase [Endomicrobium sp.]
MCPIVFVFGNFRFFSYGFFIALAFITSIFYLSKSLNKSKNKIFSQDELSSLFIYIMFFGIIGARFLFVIVNFHEFILSPLDIFKIWHGGLVYYGGFISVLIFLIIYSKIKKLCIRQLGDFFAPALALGHAIGRIGCFFAGCCYGVESNFPCAVVFNNKYSLATTGVPLHPTQLYEAFGNFIIFVFLHFYSKKKHKIGALFVFYIIIYAVLRFVIEFFRGDYRGVCYFCLSISQVISVLLFLIGVFYICKRE